MRTLSIGAKNIASVLPFMKPNCAFTWVWNDMIALELWCKYYSRYFEDLLVLCCATDPKYDSTLARFKEQYNLTAERLERQEYDVTSSMIVVRAKQAELLQTHEWVMFSNCDEIVATDPAFYKDLKEFMDKCEKDWEWCLGYEVCQEPEESHLDMNQPILKQRTTWLKNPYNNKVLIGRVPLSWNEGLQQIVETTNIEIGGMENHGLILVHLKHADYYAPGRDLIPNVRPRYGYVMEKFASREPMPEWVREVI